MTCEQWAVYPSRLLDLCWEFAVKQFRAFGTLVGFPNGVADVRGSLGEKPIETSTIQDYGEQCDSERAREEKGTSDLCLKVREVMFSCSAYLKNGLP